MCPICSCPTAQGSTILRKWEQMFSSVCIFLPWQRGKVGWFAVHGMWHLEPAQIQGLAKMPCSKAKLPTILQKHCLLLSSGVSLVAVYAVRDLSLFHTCTKHRCKKAVLRNGLFSL